MFSESIMMSVNWLVFILAAASIIVLFPIFSILRKYNKYKVLYEHIKTEYGDLKVSSYNKIRDLLHRSQNDMREKVEYYEKELRQEKDKSRRYLSDRKSSEVRTGHILEKVAPLFKDFPGDIEKDNVIPVFKTFDYLVITDDEIILVEVKSGNAGLSTRQKKVKKLVEEGKVSFRTFRKRGIIKAPGDNDVRKKD